MTWLKTGNWMKVTSRIYLSYCEPDGVNCGLVVGDQHLLLIDTGSHPQQGKELAESAEKLVGRRVDQVMITHHHRDHWFGLAGIKNVEVFGHEFLLEASKDPEVLDEASSLGIDKDSLVTPNKTISLVKGLDLGSVRAEILHFGPAHTKGDLLAFIPSENVVFVGDLLESSQDPQFSEDSDLLSWPSALDAILGAVNENTIFIPGHGKPVDRVFAFKQRAEIAFLYTECEYLIKQGVRLEDAAQATQWPFTTHTLGKVLPIIYTQLAKEGLTPKTQLPLWSKE